MASKNTSCFPADHNSGNVYRLGDNFSFATSVLLGVDILLQLCCGKIVIFAIFAKFASIANFYGPPHYFVLCQCAKTVIFAIFAKYASIANFYGPLIAL